jgi:hypothetical protein
MEIRPGSILRRRGREVFQASGAGDDEPAVAANRKPEKTRRRFEEKQDNMISCHEIV